MMFSTNRFGQKPCICIIENQLGLIFRHKFQVKGLEEHEHYNDFDSVSVVLDIIVIKLVLSQLLFA